MTYSNGLTRRARRLVRCSTRHHLRAGRRQRQRQVDHVQGDHGLRPARRPARSRLCGRPVAEALKRNIVAYVPQSEDVDWNFPVLVEDVVMMGRYGHMNFLRIPSRADRRKVDEALERVGMSDLPRAADRRALRRPEEARVPGALAGAGRAHHPARRAVHRRRREDRGGDHRPAARTARGRRI